MQRRDEDGGEGEEEVQEQGDVVGGEEEVQEQGDGGGGEEEVQEQGDGAEEEVENTDAAVQAKLTIGPRGDRYEQEAEAAADAAVAGRTISDPSRVSRRSQAAGEATRGGESTRPAATAAAAGAVRSADPGSPMVPATRSKLENLFGTDLTSVRVHDDGAAGDAAGKMRAKAFTSGNDIWLGHGQSQRDVPLMAHETTHVLQQGGVVRRAPVDTPSTDPGVPQAGTRTTHEAVPSDGGGGASPTPEGQDTGEEKPALDRDPVASEPVRDEGEDTEDQVATDGTSTAGEKAPEGDAATPPPTDPETPAPGGPKDERFEGVIKRLDRVALNERAHEPASQKVAEGHAAVQPPENEVDGRAQVQQVEVMAEQPAGKPDTESFLNLVRQQLRAVTPKTMKAADEFKKKGSAGELKATLTANVAAQKDASAAEITAATEAEPDRRGISVKEVITIPEPAAEEPAPALRAGDVLPLPKPEQEISVAHHKDEADQLMADNDIDEEQLERANEPQFSEALEAKKELDAHVDEVPAAYREQEEGYLSEAEDDAAAREAAATRDMRADREHAQDEVLSEQQELKRKEEAERLRITGAIEAMYQATTEKVRGKLEALDEEVDRLFDEGEQRARGRFETDVSGKMSAYKWHRYISRVGGTALWLKDQFLGLPDEVNRFYEESRERYIADMAVVIVRIADTVEARLQEVREDIAEGRRQIQSYVDELPEAQRKLGQEAQDGVSDKFDELESDVENKKQELASQLADRYEKAREDLDARIEELKAANQGLLDAFIGKLRRIIEVLGAFRDRIVPLLRTGSETVRGIIKDPIGFLGNLLGAVKKGFHQFSGNILVHLKKGLASWLFGTLAKAGVELPTEFSPKAVFGLVLQVLGITRERIRAKVTRLIGTKNAERLGKAWSVVSTLISEGPAGLWNQAKEKLSDLKDTVIGKIRDWVITRVIQQAVVWLVSLFNPAAALLKVIGLIYDVIMFFVQNIERIIDLVEAVVTSVAKIVAGAIGAAANWIEAAMGRTVPVIIGFMARLLRLGGISDTIRSIITSIQKRVDKVIDNVLAKIVRGIKKLLRKGKAAARKGVEKLVKWWTVRKGFKLDGHQHQLHFKGKGKDAEIAVSSKTKTLHEFLAAESNKKDVDKVKLEAIRVQAKKVDDLKKNPFTGKDIAMSKKQGEKICKALGELARLLAELHGLAVVPSTPTIMHEPYTSGDDTNAKGFEAKPLSIDPGSNSGSEPEPDQKSKLWQKVSQRRNTYVRGHLLNHHLHGPGVKKNLTPITIGLNNRMRAGIEDEAKKRVLQQNLVVSYTVQVEYGSDSARKHLPAEGKLAKSIKAELVTMDRNPGSKGDQVGDWIKPKTSDTKKEFAAQHDLPDDTPLDAVETPVNAVETPVNLSIDGAKQIAEHAAGGVDLDTAERIVAARPTGKVFHSYRQLVDSGVDAETVERLRSATRVKLR